MSRPLPRFVEQAVLSRQTFLRIGATVGFVELVALSVACALWFSWPLLVALVVFGVMVGWLAEEAL